MSVIQTKYVYRILNLSGRKWIYEKATTNKSLMIRAPIIRVPIMRSYNSRPYKIRAFQKNCRFSKYQKYI